MTTSERTVLIDGGRDGHYLPTGHLVYALDNVLFAVPFDVDSREVTGGPVPLEEGVRGATVTGAMQFSVSTTGSLIYVPDDSVSTDRTLALVGRNGVVETLNMPPAPYQGPRLSPDRGKLVVQTAEADGGVLWLYDLAGDTQIQQLTFEGDNHASSSWWSIR